VKRGFLGKPKRSQRGRKVKHHSNLGPGSTTEGKRISLVGPNGRKVEEMEYETFSAIVEKR